MPKVSVVMPIFNAEKYIGNSIDSVLKQTYSDFNCICVDDGSTDGTRDVIAKYDDPRIVYISQTNQGESGARNTGIAKADCEWVAFLDADDWWYEMKLEKQLAVAELFRDMGMIGCRINRIEDGNSWIEPKTDVIDPLQQFGKISDFFAFYYRYVVVHSSSVMVRRDVFNRIGVFDLSLEYGGDLEMWCRVGGCCDVGFTNYIGSAYRIVPSSKTVAKKFKDREIVLDRGFESPGWVDRFVRVDQRESFSRMYDYQRLMYARELMRVGYVWPAIEFLKRVSWSKIRYKDCLSLLIPLDRIPRSLLR